MKNNDIVCGKNFDYTKWQRAYFDAKSPAEISREAEQYEKDHPFQGNAVRLTRRLCPEDSDPVADIFLTQTSHIQNISEPLYSNKQALEKSTPPIESEDFFSNAPASCP